MRVVAIIQARMGSQRLPGKSLMLIRGVPLLQLVIERVKQARTVDTVVLATSTKPENDPLCTLAQSLGIGVYRGSEEDVLSRFAGAAREAGAEMVVRVCADNPLVDPGEIDRLARFHRESGARYSFNHVPTRKNRYPDGLGAEIMGSELLFLLDREAQDAGEREHVTLRARRHPANFAVGEPVAPPEVMGPDIRLDIDTPADFERMKGFIESLPAEGAPFWTAAEIVRSYRDHFRSRVLVILDRREDARAYSTLYHGKIPGALPLAASPGAWWELEQGGIPCLLIQDSFDRLEIYRLGMENFRTAEAVSRVVDGELAKQQEAVRLHGLEPARYDIYNLKVLLDNLAIRANLLGKVLERERPGLVCVVAPPDHCRVPDRDPDAFFRNDLNWFPVLLDLGCGKCRFTTLDYPPEESGRNGITVRRSPGPTLARVPFLYPLALTFRFSGVLEALRITPSYILNRLRGSRPLILPGYGYDWNRIIPDLISRGWHPRPLGIDRPVRLDGLSHPDLPWKDEAARLLVSGGIDLSGPILSYMGLRLQETLACIPAAIGRMERETGPGGPGPAALLSGPRMGAVEHLHARLAQRSGLPVVTWQMGAYGAHRAPIMLYVEFMNSDLVLAWGKGVEETMRADSLNTFPCRIEPVGSVGLEEMVTRSGGGPGKPALLYVTTSYYGNRLYVSYEYPFHDNHLWETQRAVIDALGDNRESILKLHPGAVDDEHIREYIRSRGYGKMRVVRAERTLPELFAEADAVIIDFPHTSLLQAIAAGKTVFVLTRHTRLSDEAMALLRKRAYCTDDLQEFTGMIRAHVEGRPVPGSPDRADTEFLERYGVVRADGGVVARALGALEGLLRARTGGRGSG